MTKRHPPKFKINDKVTTRDISWQGGDPIRVRARITAVKILKGKRGYYYHIKPLRADVNKLVDVDGQEYDEMYKHPNSSFTPQANLIRGWNKITGYV